MSRPSTRRWRKYLGISEAPLASCTDRGLLLEKTRKGVRRLRSRSNNSGAYCFRVNAQRRGE
jgi:hypothetical protein